MDNKPIITKDTHLAVIERIGAECRRCNSCCKYDSGIVLAEDIPRIAKHLRLTEDKFKGEYLVEHEKFNTKCHKLRQVKEKGKLYGQCIFLDEKGCKVHAVKPLHCKVCSPRSQFGEALSHWFALNYLVNPAEPESIRQWASFLKDNITIQGGRLHELVPDKEKLRKILSYEIFR